MAKELKLWNGRGPAKGEYKNGTLYVAAYSRKQAADLINLAFKTWITEYEIKNYFSQCWGDSMKGIVATKPCIYAQVHGEKPKCVYKL